MINKVFQIIIERNEDIKSKIGNFILKQGWNSAYISGAIGSARDLKLITPICMNLPPKTEISVLTGPGEVLAFTGEVMKWELMDPELKDIYKSNNMDLQSSLFIHIHVSVAIAGGHVYGGGLLEGKAFRKLKVYIQPQD